MMIGHCSSFIRYYIHLMNVQVSGRYAGWRSVGFSPPNGWIKQKWVPTSASLKKRGLFFAALGSFGLGRVESTNF